MAKKTFFPQTRCKSDFPLLTEKEIFHRKSFSRQYALYAQSKNTEFHDCVFEFCEFSFSLWENVLFHNCLFLHCSLEGAKFLHGKWENCKIQSCDILKTQWERCHFQNCILKKSNMPGSWFSHTSFISSHWKEIDLEQSHFGYLTLENTKVAHSNLKNTQWEACHFKKVFWKNLQMGYCSFSNTFFDHICIHSSDLFYARFYECKAESLCTSKVDTTNWQNLSYSFPSCQPLSIFSRLLGVLPFFFSPSSEQEEKPFLLYPFLGKALFCFLAGNFVIRICKILGI